MSTQSRNGTLRRKIVFFFQWIIYSYTIFSISDTKGHGYPYSNKTVLELVFYGKYNCTIMQVFYIGNPFISK